MYGRVGTSMQRFGVLTSFLIDALNVLTGNLDRPGGAMFPLPVAGNSTTHGKPGPGRGMRWGRWSSRVRGAPEFAGELPLAVLAEEIEAPGAGQVRALIVFAGNPVLSGPNGRRLERALDTLDAMISVDIYRNETSRHAHVILPSPPILTRGFAPAFPTWNACRNFADYTSPSLPLGPGDRSDGEIALRLAAIVEGRDPNAEDIAARMAAMVDERFAAVATDLGLPHEEVRARAEAAQPPELLLECNIRMGPYGDRFATRPGLTFGAVRDDPDGVDLGPLRPRLDDIVRTVTGKVELAPEAIRTDTARLREDLDAPAPGLLLFGRRDRRSMNSWLHNVEELVTDRDRCTAQLHPLDAGAIGVSEGEPVTLTSRVGEVTLPAEVTDAVMPGSVCVPHGFGHDRPGVELGLAARRPGVSYNDLSDDAVIEPLSGTAVFSGVPITATAPPA